MFSKRKVEVKVESNKKKEKVSTIASNKTNRKDIMKK